jgi:hypothetical protein
MNIKEILEKSIMFEKQAQTTFDAGAIQDTLTAAGLWEKSNEVSKMVNKLDVPENATIAISIIINKGPVVGFLVNINPPNKASSILSNALKTKYSALMASAIKKLPINSQYVLKWINF